MPSSSTARATNLEADVRNDEHSNVARLYRLHSEDDAARNIFRYYIPGIGTRFQLLGDAVKLQALVKTKGRDKLRPHYRAVLDAYEAELKGQGLHDQELIAFFDTYVHDSLAGFAKDATLPSDPRVIYIGGDDKLRYAVNPPSKQGSPFSTTA